MDDAEEVQAGSADISSKRCAYCGEPLPFNTVGIVAWRVGSQLVCNEFCAEGVANEPGGAP